MKKLPKNVQSLLSASNQLNNHRKVVEELVYNSLDAGATSVAIRVNIEDNFLQVIDNGCGISKKDLKCIGQNYMTSKFTDLSTLNSAPSSYGFRGQFLANLIHITMFVKVISRHENSGETWMKLFENGKEKQNDIFSTRASKGTTVEVKGFLYNLNKKKKIRSSWNDLQSIKTFLEHLSLLHSNISLSLRDDTKNEIVFKMHKNRDMYQTLLTLYNIEKYDIQELKVEKNEYKVRGILGKSDKECYRNVIFLNGKFISDSSKLHKIVNNNIKSHLHLNDRKIRKVKNLNKDEESYLYQNKIPFYFIFITCPYYTDYNLSNSPKQSILEFKDWDQVHKLLEKLIKFFAGDLNPKEICKDDRDKAINKVSDTREKVKKIMDKILGTYTKKPGISHVQKGIKGKQIKRKAWKQCLNKLVPNAIDHKANNKNPAIHYNNEEEKNIHHCNNFIVKKHATNKNHNERNSKNLNKNLKSGLPTNIGKIYNSTFKKVSKYDESVRKEPERIKSVKNISKSKKHKSFRDNLKRKFQMEPDSRKKRCKELDQKAKHNLNKKIKQKGEMHISETVRFSNTTENNRNVSVGKKINENVIPSYLPKPDNNKRNPNYIVEKKRFPSNYDLLETILKSQQDAKIQSEIIIGPRPLVALANPAPRETNDEVYRSFNLQSSENSTDPKVTFQSHHYYAYKNYLTSTQSDLQMGDDYQSFNKKPRNFITKQSKENFTISKNGRKGTSKNKHSKQVATNIKKKLKKSSKLFSLKKQFIDRMGETSYTIEFTKSNVINSNKVSNTKHARHLSELDSLNNPFSANIDENWTNSANNNNCSDYAYDHKISINATYTINTKHNDDDWYKNGTYTIEDCNENYMCNQNISLNNDSNSKNYIFISKSQELDRNEEVLDPMTVCETILHSQEIPNKQSELNTNNKTTNDLESSLFESLNISNHKNKPYSEENNDLIAISLDFDQMSQKTLKEPLYNFRLPNNKFLNSDIDAIIETSYIQNKEHNTKIKKLNTEEGVFKFKNRPCFLPKGMSPIFENCHTKNICQYNMSGEYFEDGMYNNFIDSIRNHAEVFEPKIQEAQEVKTRAIDKVNAKVNKYRSSLKFDGKDLKDAKVLGQVDEKFIAAIIRGGCYKEGTSDFLVLFDQHAVHERIRLENNLLEYLVDNQWLSVNIDEITLKISKDEALYLHNYKDKFKQLGLHWTILNCNEVSFNAIPAAILGRNLREVEKIIKAVKKLITEGINILKMQGGCMSLYPKSIMELVFSEACRYAIKFGEKLSKDRCAELLKELSQCKTPFQCAHGRPSMAVIMEINMANDNYGVNINKIMEWKSKILQ